MRLKCSLINKQHYFGEIYIPVLCYILCAARIGGVSLLMPSSNKLKTGWLFRWLRINNESFSANAYLENCFDTRAAICWLSDMIFLASREPLDSMPG
jgi:hypothetical protein